MTDDNTFIPASTPDVAAASGPKRSATPGTRRGNGAGWGGPAKGVGTKGGKRHADFEPGNQVAAKPAKG